MLKLLLILFGLVLPFQSFADVKTIEVKHRAAVDLVASVREILDDGEKIQSAGGYLVLVADGESLAAAEQLIALLDRPQKTLIISIRHSKDSLQVGKEAKAQIHYGTTTGLPVSTGTGYRIGTSTENQEQTLFLIEGEKGMIEVAREIPYTKNWAALTGRLTGYSETTDYKTIAAGFWVHPLKIMGDKVLIDVHPYIADAGITAANIPPQINHGQLRTRLHVPFGEWYPLGSQLMNQDKVSRAIVSWRGSNTRADRQLQIRIEPVE